MELVRDDVDLSHYLREPGVSESVKPASHWKKEVRDSFFAPAEKQGAYLPWVKTHHLIRLRKGEVSLWPGVTHHGKSLATSQVALGLCNQGERVCIASMEMKPVATMRRMTRQAANAEEPALSYINRFHDWTDDRLWIFDHHGQVKAERMVALVRYCVDRFGITQFFIDSLMKCVRGEDDYNGQKDFVDALVAAAHDTNTHIHLVHHMKKLEHETDVPTTKDCRGAQSIADQVDNIFIWWRNKKKERDRELGKEIEEANGDAVLIADKQRNGEWNGRIALWFNRRGMTFRGQVKDDAEAALDLGMRQPGEDDDGE